MQEKVCIDKKYSKRFGLDRACMLHCIEHYIDENDERIEFIDDMVGKLMDYTTISKALLDRHLRRLREDRIIAYVPRYDYNDPVDEIRWYIKLDRERLNNNLEKI